MSFLALFHLSSSFFALKTWFVPFSSSPFSHLFPLPSRLSSVRIINFLHNFFLLRFNNLVYFISLFVLFSSFFAFLLDCSSLKSLIFRNSSSLYYFVLSFYPSSPCLYFSPLSPSLSFVKIFNFLHYSSPQNSFLLRLNNLVCFISFFALFSSFFTFLLDCSSLKSSFAIHHLCIILFYPSSPCFQFSPLPPPLYFVKIFNFLHHSSPHNFFLLHINNLVCVISFFALFSSSFAFLLGCPSLKSSIFRNSSSLYNFVCLVIFLRLIFIFLFFLLYSSSLESAIFFIIRLLVTF